MENEVHETLGHVFTLLEDLDTVIRHKPVKALKGEMLLRVQTQRADVARVINKYETVEQFEDGVEKAMVEAVRKS